MLSIRYSSYFVRKFKKLDRALQDDIVDKIELFKAVSQHKRLAVHKLGGKMKGQWAFSVSSSIRIVFYFENNKRTAHLLDVGDHSIYE